VKKISGLLKANKNYSNGELAEKIGVSVRSLERNIKNMRNE
jgi:predicted DNA-binding transcriptional regulator YafY